ncbi:hypothetical protein CRENBAI_020286 [Crenichthys baileyi]|uniref:Uncharacterized protein n=1 Tax=Crenichthys baileyi TaxID=28760 RepID=A0AAV9RIQ1_9TELE
MVISLPSQFPHIPSAPADPHIRLIINTCIPSHFSACPVFKFTCCSPLRSPVSPPDYMPVTQSCSSFCSPSFLGVSFPPLLNYVHPMLLSASASHSITTEPQRYLQFNCWLTSKP